MTCPSCGAPYKPKCDYCGNEWERAGIRATFTPAVLSPAGILGLQMAQQQQVQNYTAQLGCQRAINSYGGIAGSVIGSILGGINW